MGEDSKNKTDSIVQGLTGRLAGIYALVALVASGVSGAIVYVQEKAWYEIVVVVLAVLAIVAFVLWSDYRHRRRTRAGSVTPPKDSAFRGLLPYEENDAERFYGREIDIGELDQMLRYSDFRFGVLTGESGCGKTSLLRAGLVPRLRENGCLPVYVRLYREPKAMIKAAVKQATGLPCADEEDLIAYLRRVAKENEKTLVLCCDQFEEFFIRFPADERTPFLTFVGRCFHDSELPVKFLFSLRDDFLVRISEFKGHIPEPLASDKWYQLSNLDTEQTADIIQRSVQTAGVPFEAGLSDLVAQDLAVDDRVLPTEVQIVCQQMQRRRIFSAERYRRSGGKESLVYGALEDVVKASGNEQEVKLVLRSMISEENTKLTLTLAEICAHSQQSKAPVGAILDSFVGARLIREIQDDKPWRYEFMHEYLIDKINAISGSEMNATKRANLAFKDWMRRYDREKKTRIPLGDWYFIRRYSDLKRGSKETELLSKSRNWGLVKYGCGSVVLISSVLGVGWHFQGQIRMRDCTMGRLKVDNDVGARLTITRTRIFKGDDDVCSPFRDVVMNGQEADLEGPADYTLTAEKDGWTVKYPLHIERFDHTLEVLVSPPPTDIPENLAYIPPGWFRMGDKDASDGIQSNEMPHDVNLQGFFIDKTEVTVQAFAEFIGEGGYDELRWWDEEGLKFLANVEQKRPRYWEDKRFNNPDQADDNRPVVGVSWHEANAYCQWKGKRLPTEAEWEKAARGPEGYKWSFDNEWKASRANATGTEDGHEYAAPVASFDANGYGLFDMSGNVWEWVQDSYSADFYKQENAEINPVNDTKGADRVLRGGSWIIFPVDLRASSRKWLHPSGGDYSFVVGFRCARTP